MQTTNRPQNNPQSVQRTCLILLPRANHIFVSNFADKHCPWLGTDHYRKVRRRKGGGQKACKEEWREKNSAKERGRKIIPAEWIALSGLQIVPAWRTHWQPLNTAVLISLSWWKSHSPPKGARPLGTRMGSFAIKQAAHTVFWKPRQIEVISQLICINDDCGHRCAHLWRNVISPHLPSSKIKVGQKSSWRC